MSFLNNFSNPTSFKVRGESNDSYHIFTRMLDFHKDDMKTSDYMGLYFFHNTNEKCLSFLRKKDLKTGVYFYNSLQEIDRTEFPLIVSSGVEATFFASEAYYDYVNQHYEPAISKLRKAIKYSVEQAKTMPQFTQSLYELNLNILRVYIKERKIELVIEKFSDLLASLLFSENQVTDFDASLNELPGLDRMSMANHILNNVIFSISELKAFTPDIQQEIYKNVLAKASIQTKNTEIAELSALQWDLQTIQHYFNKDNETFLARLNQGYSHFAKTPFYVRKMLLSQFLEIQKESLHEISLHQHFSNFEKILKDHNLEIKLPELVN